MTYDLTASGKRLQELRKQMGKTQEEVAEQIGLSTNGISKIERGNKGCSVDTLLEFSEFYGVSVDYILKGDDGCNMPDANGIRETVPEGKRKAVMQIMKLVVGLVNG